MNERPYNLHERIALFAKDVRTFLKTVPRTAIALEDIKQLTRSSGSIGANYLEANDGLGTKDILFRFRISRKEAKETAFWLQLLDIGLSTELNKERNRLHDEAGELVKILSAIINKLEITKHQEPNSK